ncbi:MAG: SPASM domain-containing protein [Candidatus Omnitrophica bacterium]|nr:SPASM domain-containing protein [Candidatus Omnitrophota bacterium]
MRSRSDQEIKDLFHDLKALMFWEHDSRFDGALRPFALRKNDLVAEYRDMPQEVLCQKANAIQDFTNDFPLSVYIETTNTCNLRCVMCPHAGLSRPSQIMSDGLFRKIIDEIADVQPSITVSPFYFGEPLTDSGIFDRIKYCKKKGLSFLKMSTNGSLLNVKDNYCRLVDSGLDHLIISFDGITANTYEAIRCGSKFDSFVKGVQQLVDYKRRTGSPIRLVGQMILMGDNSGERESFSRFISEMGLTPYFASFQYWGAPVPAVGAALAHRYACNNPLYSAVILANGDLVACCMDYAGKAVFGNLGEAALAEIWRGKHRELRQAQLDGDYNAFDVCRRCSDWVSFGFNQYSRLIQQVKKG